MKASGESSNIQDSTPVITSETSLSSCEGFTLTESLIAIFIVTIGMMAVAQMMFVSLAGLTLARAKGNAVTVAQDQLDILTNMYRQNPEAPDLSIGTHTAIQVAITNPVDSTTLDRYSVQWTVSAVTDARGWTIKARQVLITVTPIQSTGTATNIKKRLNKVFNMSTVLSPRWS